MAQPNLRCPRNGKWTSQATPLSTPPLDAFNRIWEGLISSATSPDTGQQGGRTQVRL